MLDSPQGVIACKGPSREPRIIKEDIMDQYEQGNYSADLVKQSGTTSVGERLEQESIQLRARLAEVEAAIAALKSNPEIDAIINLVSKVYRY